MFYVDDIIILYSKTNQAAMDKLHEQLTQTYQLRIMDKFEWFLGIRIIRDRKQKKIWLTKDSYIEKIASIFDLKRQTAYTPISKDLKPYSEQATPQEINQYQQRVGSSLYAAIMTRPDAAKPASKLAEFLLNPSPEHISQANRAISYLYTTRFYAIEYSAPNINDSEVFICASDAAYGDHFDRKSSEGYICKLYGGPVDWRAAKQKTVSTSTTEAELLALSEARKRLYV